MAYTKHIAVIKEIKDGFSADGGSLSGLVKAEKYGSELSIEVTYLNFAPLTEGRYVCAVSDGVNTLIVENGKFEGSCALDADAGFGALVCYINGGVFPVASAVCGNYGYAVLGIKAEVERLENLKTAPREEKYEDEAIAEDNYYEYEDNESGGAVRADKTQEEDGGKVWKDEEAFSAFKEEQNGIKNKLTPEYPAFNALTGGIFYEKMKSEIENIFKTYPPEENLEALIEGSRWAKIDYGDGKFYVFGVLYSGGNAEYICYGVPTDQSKKPPESMKNLASFIPVRDGESQEGFWIMYQDAKTGASVKITNI